MLLWPEVRELAENKGHTLLESLVLYQYVCRRSNNTTPLWHLLSTRHCPEHFTHDWFDHTGTYQVGTVAVPSLRVRKLRPREAR